jgi:lysine-specific demethylase 8
MSEPLADDSEHEEGVPYLAYFDIFKTFPGLRKDVDFSFWKGRFTFPVGWIGPAGTYTGLHYDIAPNLFAQFYGEKEFTLYPPEQTPFLYPATKYDIGSVLSEVDARSPDMSAHPLFAHANGVKVRVEAGQVLYTPAGWWHDVLGLETSISISCFGFNAREALLRGIPGAIRHGLHSLGLYRKGNCACHRRSAVRIRSKSGSTS